MKAVIVVLFICLGTYAEVFQHQLTYRGHKINERKSNVSAKISNLVTSTNTLYDNRDVIYTMDIKVGSPSTTLRVLFDTGEPDSWFSSIDCGYGCIGTKRFDYTLSTSYVPTEQTGVINYGTFSVSWNYGIDTIGIGNLIVPNNTFGAANTLTLEDPNFEYDGVIAGGFQDASQIKTMPVLQQALQNGQLDSPVFTTYIENHGFDDDHEHSGGVLTIGGQDSVHCSNVSSTVSIVNGSGVWITSASKLSYGSFTMNRIHTMVLASGSAYILGSFAFVDSMAQVVGASYSTEYSAYTVPCNVTVPDFTIVYSSFTLTVTDANQKYKVNVNPDVCVWAIQGQGNNYKTDPWILGLPFYRQYCIIHNMQDKSVSFSTPMVGS